GTRGVDWSLSARVLRGEPCGQELDRDLNAATTVAKRAASSSASHTACGEASAGYRLAAGVHLAPVKQEPAAFDAPAYNGNFWRTRALNARHQSLQLDAPVRKARWVE